MSARNPINYTPAERASFDLVPPTCDAIDAKREELTRFFSHGLAEASLRGNRIEPTPQLLRAVQEAVIRHLWPALHELALTAKMEGTYPLRQALIEQIERREVGQASSSHYPRWIAQGRADLAACKRRREASTALETSS